MVEGSSQVLKQIIQVLELVLLGRPVRGEAAMAEVYEVDVALAAVLSDNEVILAQIPMDHALGVDALQDIARSCMEIAITCKPASMANQVENCTRRPIVETQEGLLLSRTTSSLKSC